MSTEWWFNGQDEFRNVHIIPDGDSRPHEGTVDCWCQPLCTEPCPVCDCQDGECWRCKGEGGVEVEPAPRGRMFIHNAEDKAI